MAEAEGENQESTDDKLAREALESGRLPKKARAKYLAALAVVAATVALGNILLKYGFQHMHFGSFHSFLAMLKVVPDILSNLWLDLGILLLIANFAALTVAFRYGPISLTVPVRGAASYVGTSLLAVFFLGEHMTPIHWTGVVLVFLGVGLIGLSGGKG